jgi:hypothetical protein
MPMTTSSVPRPLDRSRARNCILLNQLATPGLGSIMAGRRLAGAGQLLVAVAGFVMICGWFAVVAMNNYNNLVNDSPPQPSGWLGGAGAITFAASWLWALVTSLEIHHSVQPDADPPGVPPRLN